MARELCYDIVQYKPAYYQSTCNYQKYAALNTIINYSLDHATLLHNYTITGGGLHDN